MNKLFKGLFVTVLAAGLLVGCGPEPVVTHTVTFYEDTVGKFYAEVEVEHGTAVDMPADQSSKEKNSSTGLPPQISRPHSIARHSSSKTSIFTPSSVKNTNRYSDFLRYR
jgi:hypothetical protein